MYSLCSRLLCPFYKEGTLFQGGKETMSSGILVAQAASNLAPQGTTGLTPDSGATAWVLMSTCLVLFMTLPGLMLFYGKQRCTSRSNTGAALS